MFACLEYVRQSLFYDRYCGGGFAFSAVEYFSILSSSDVVQTHDFQIKIFTDISLNPDFK